MQLIASAEVATFRQGNHYVLGTLLFAISATEKGMINWAN